MYVSRPKIGVAMRASRGVSHRAALSWHRMRVIIMVVVMVVMRMIVPGVPVMGMPGMAVRVVMAFAQQPGTRQIHAQADRAIGAASRKWMSTGWNSRRTNS